MVWRLAKLLGHVNLFKFNRFKVKIKKNQLTSVKIYGAYMFKADLRLWFLGAVNIHCWLGIRLSLPLTLDPLRSVLWVVSHLLHLALRLPMINTVTFFPYSLLMGGHLSTSNQGLTYNISCLFPNFKVEVNRH